MVLFGNVARRGQVNMLEVNIKYKHKKRNKYKYKFFTGEGTTWYVRWNYQIQTQTHISFFCCKRCSKGYGWYSEDLKKYFIKWQVNMLSGRYLIKIYMNLNISAITYKKCIERYRWMYLFSNVAGEGTSQYVRGKCTWLDDLSTFHNNMSDQRIKGTDT